MAFFNQAINILQTLVVAIGAGLAVWGLLTCWKDMETITQVQSPRESSS